MSTPTNPPGGEKVPLGQTLGAPTLLDTAIAARRQRGEKIEDPTQVKNQFTVKQVGQGDEGAAGSPQPGQITRRVQQDPEEQQEESRVMDFMGTRLFGDRYKKQQEGGEQKPQQKQPQQKPQGQQQQPQQKQVSVTKAPRTVSADDIAAITERAATAAVKAALQSKEQQQDEGDGKKQADDLAHLDEDDRYNHEVFETMAKRHPEKYKDLPTKLVTMAKQKRDYEAKWKAENPDGEFSWDEEEHAQFLEKISPEFNDRDFRRAEVAIEAEKIASERVGEVRKQFEQIEAETVQASLGNKMVAESKKAIQDFHSEFAPDGDWDLATEAGRKKVIEEEPVLGPIAVKWASVVDNATRELVKIFDGKSRDGKMLFKVDPKNEMHQWIGMVVDSFEDKLSQVDNDSTRNKAGQTFMPRDQWQKLPPEQRKRYWTIMRDQAMWIVKQAALENANYERDQEIAKVERIAKRQGWRFNPDSVVTQRRKVVRNNDGIDNPGEGADPTGFGSDSGLIPSAREGTRTDTVREQLQEGDKTFVSSMMQKLFQRDK